MTPPPYARGSPAHARIDPGSMTLEIDMVTAGICEGCLDLDRKRHLGVLMRPDVTLVAALLVLALQRCAGPLTLTQETKKLTFDSALMSSPGLHRNLAKDVRLSGPGDQTVKCLANSSVYIRWLDVQFTPSSESSRKRRQCFSNDNASNQSAISSSYFNTIKVMQMPSVRE